MKTELRSQAIYLRKKGETYSEIQRQVPVAKSTLSLWFRSVQLASEQKQRITQKRLDAARRGAVRRRSQRLEQVNEFVVQGTKDIGLLSKRELWLIGIALYWAEGSKQNVRSPSAGIIFSNSDPAMHLLFMQWLQEIGVSESNVVYDLYVHTNRASEIKSFKAWWSKKLRIPVSKFEKVYLKKGNPKTKRSNVGSLYHGLVRIKVKESTVLNRRIHGWIEGLGASWGVV